MQLSDLKTGMIVTTRDGREWCVLKDFECTYEGAKEKNAILCYSNMGGRSWTSLSNHSEMKNNGFMGDSLDIVKVEVPYHPHGFLDLEYERDKRKLLWQEEPEIKEVTMSEVEEKFGCKVKIVGG